MELTRDGRTHRYEVSGRGTETAVLIPALGTTYEMWGEQVRALEPEYRVLAYDPAGHDSGSLYPQQPSLSDYAEDLKGLLTATHTARPHVVGISIGGMIAQQYAISYPDAVASLVLACTTSEYSEEQRQQMLQRAGEAEAVGMSAIAANRAEAWFTEGFRRSDEDTVSWVRAMVAAADARAYAQAVRAVAQLNTAPHLQGIRCPVLVIAAEKDGSTPPGAAERVAAGIPNAALHTIHDASHLCNVEKPSEFNAAVLRFLKGMPVAADLDGEPSA